MLSLLVIVLLSIQFDCNSRATISPRNAFFSFDILKKKLTVNFKGGTSIKRTRPHRMFLLFKRPLGGDNERLRQRYRGEAFSSSEGRSSHRRFLSGVAVLVHRRQHTFGGHFSISVMMGMVIVDILHGGQAPFYALGGQRRLTSRRRMMVIL